MASERSIAERVTPFLAVLVWLWIVVVVGFSWLSGSVEASCVGEACVEKVRTAWAVLMGLQALWVVATIVASLRPRLRVWGLLAGALLTTATLAVVNALAYPPGSLI